MKKDHSKKHGAGSEMNELIDNIAKFLEVGKDGLSKIPDERKEVAKEFIKSITSIIKHDFPKLKSILGESSPNILKEVDQELKRLNMNPIIEKSTELVKKQIDDTYPPKNKNKRK